MRWLRRNVGECGGSVKNTVARPPRECGAATPADQTRVRYQRGVMEADQKTGVLYLAQSYDGGLT